MNEERQDPLPIHERCVEHKSTINKLETWSLDRDKLWVTMETKIGNKLFFASLSFMVALLVSILGWSMQASISMDHRVEDNRVERVAQLDELKRTLGNIALDQRETQVLLREYLKQTTKEHSTQ